MIKSFSSVLCYETTGVSLAAGGTTGARRASITVTVRPGANVTQIPESACADPGLQGTECPVLQVSIARLYLIKENPLTVVTP